MVDVGKKKKDQSDSQNSVAEGEHAVVGEKTMENSHWRDWNFEEKTPALAASCLPGHGRGGLEHSLGGRPRFRTRSNAAAVAYTREGYMFEWCYYDQLLFKNI